MIISKNISLKEFTTIKIGGKAKKIYFPENISDINNLADISKKARTVILGKGSNIAFKDYGYAGDIISFKYFDRKGLYLLDNKYITDLDYSEIMLIDENIPLLDDILVFFPTDDNLRLPI